MLSCLSAAYRLLLHRLQAVEELEDGEVPLCPGGADHGGQGQLGGGRPDELRLAGVVTRLLRPDILQQSREKSECEWLEFQQAAYRANSSNCQIPSLAPFACTPSALDAFGDLVQQRVLHGHGHFCGHLLRLFAIHSRLPCVVGGRCWRR